MYFGSATICLLNEHLVDTVVVRLEDRTLKGGIKYSGVVGAVTTRLKGISIVPNDVGQRYAILAVPELRKSSLKFALGTFPIFNLSVEGTNTILGIGIGRSGRGTGAFCR